MSNASTYVAEATRPSTAAFINRMADAVLSMSPADQARWERGVRSCMAVTNRTRGAEFTERCQDVRCLREVERRRGGMVQS